MNTLAHFCDCIAMSMHQRGRERMRQGMWWEAETYRGESIQVSLFFSRSERAYCSRIGRLFHLLPSQYLKLHFFPLVSCIFIKS